MRLTARQNDCVAALGQYGQMGTARLRELLGSSRQGAAQTAASLCDRGLARRVSGGGATFYELTDKGREYLAEEPA